ncbi:DUF4397 domain-containing protein [Steroidobacter agaridevorans]|uniref:DUF4397 domain-containing protein n=1 Tax=Steroidobacter agaridevorans TaxID=2695856 RepID=UPI001329BDEE|nr:DUF4397 domain-containing protein [Steroidobacter agaridevorans]GFE90443.1 hypothetical protein GCM10011488_53970 [Steroidobacter agaridevorans]
MRTWIRAAGGVASLGLLTACSNGSLNEAETTFHLRSLNLVENSPTLQIDIDDTTLSSAGYGGATSFSAGHPGEHTLSFSAILPADLDDDDDDDETETPVSGASAYTFLAGTEYTVVAYGRMEDIRTYMIEGLDQREDVDDDKLVLQFTHASPDTPAVDVYVTAVKAGITSRYYVDTLAITETTSPLELSLVRDDDDLDDDSTLTADVVVELLAAGTSDVLYRSESMTFSEQNRVMMAIADTNGPTATATKLLIVGSGDARDYRDGAGLKFVHISHDTPALDVTVGSGLADPLAQNVGFRQSTDYLPIDQGENGLIAVPAGVGSPYVFFEEFDAAAGGRYTAYAMGPASVVDAVVLSADARSVPTQASFRFLHGAGSLEDDELLDLYLRLPGETVDFEDDDTVPSVSSLAYQNPSSQFTLKAGDYDVFFYFAGTSTLAMGPTRFHVDNGDVKTLVLLDNESGGLELLPVSDATAAN